MIKLRLKYKAAQAPSDEGLMTGIMAHAVAAELVDGDTVMSCMVSGADLHIEPGSGLLKVTVLVDDLEVVKE